MDVLVMAIVVLTVFIVLGVLTLGVATFLLTRLPSNNAALSYQDALTIKQQREQWRQEKIRGIEEAMQMLTKIEDHYLRAVWRAELQKWKKIGNYPMSADWWPDRIRSVITEQEKNKIEAERQRQNAERKAEAMAKYNRLKGAEMQGRDVCWNCETIAPGRCSVGHCRNCSGRCPICGECGRCTGYGNDYCSICY